MRREICQTNNCRSTSTNLDTLSNIITDFRASNWLW